MFRSESESEKPREGTSRSARPINASRLSASPGKHWAPSPAAPHLSFAALGELRPQLLSSPPPASARRAARGLDTEEGGQPWTGDRREDRAESPPPGSVPSFRARDAARAHALVKFGLPPPAGLRSAPHTPPDLPRAEEARARRRLQALSARPAPREGRLESPTRTRSPPPRELGRLLAALLLPLPPPPPYPSPPGAPRLPSPTRPPAPRAGLSRTSLRSWRPHVFNRLAALVDGVPRSDFQARSQLRGLPQPGPSRAPRRCAPRRRGARPPPLSRTPRPGPAQPQPRAPRSQRCHPPTQGSGGCSDLGLWGCGGRRGSCRHLSPFWRRRRQQQEP